MEKNVHQMRSSGTAHRPPLTHGRHQQSCWISHMDKMWSQGEGAHSRGEIPTGALHGKRGGQGPGIMVSNDHAPTGCMI